MRRKPVESFMGAIEIARRRANGDLRHARRGWAAPRPCEDRFDRPAIALHQGFDAAVGAVAHPSGHAVPQRLRAHGIAEADPLHAARDAKVKRRPHQGIVHQSG